MSFLNLRSSQRSLSTAIWSFLIGWLVLAPPSAASSLAFFLMLLVSTASSVALLLTFDCDPSQRQFSRLSRPESIMAAVLVPILWAIALGKDSPASGMAILVATAIVPVTAVWTATMLSLVRWRPTAPSEFPCGSAANLKQPQAIASTDVIFHPLHHSQSILDEDAEDDSELILGFSPIDFELPDAADMTQWQTRSRREAGEIIEGGIKIEFIEGQREAAVHVSFCPPFTQCPELTTEDLDGADLEIRIAACFPFGARLTVRRPLRSKDRTTGSAAETCRIGFIAISDSTQRAA